jgi:hypothetical protein
MKEQAKQLIIRSVGLVLATFFSSTAIGAVAGNWIMGSIIGVGSAFAIVLTMIGVSMTWQGSLGADDIQNAFRAAVAKAAESNDNLKAALEVEKDGNFDWDDVDFEDEDPEEYDPKAKDSIA